MTSSYQHHPGVAAPLEREADVIPDVGAVHVVIAVHISEQVRIESRSRRRIPKIQNADLRGRRHKEQVSRCVIVVDQCIFSPEVYIIGELIYYYYTAIIEPFIPIANIN